MSFNFLVPYWPILVFIGIAFGLSMAMVGLSILRAPQKPYAQKNSPYECGFEPFESARVPFNIHFYLVALLFIVFDLEIAFLFPWALSLRTIGWFGFWSMILFLSILTVGFIYEWKKGALEWE